MDAKGDADLWRFVVWGLATIGGVGAIGADREPPLGDRDADFDPYAVVVALRTARQNDAARAVLLRVFGVVATWMITKFECLGKTILISLIDPNFSISLVIPR